MEDRWVNEDMMEYEEKGRKEKEEERRWMKRRIL